jgi:hypothetical protein
MEWSINGAIMGLVNKILGAKCYICLRRSPTNDPSIAWTRSYGEYSFVSYVWYHYDCYYRAINNNHISGSDMVDRALYIGELRAGEQRRRDEEDQERQWKLNRVRVRDGLVPPPELVEEPLPPDPTPPAPPLVTRPPRIHPNIE